MDVMDHTARELASLIRRKKVSPVEAVRAALGRIEARADLNAFITVTAEQALADAVRAEAEVMAGDELPPLHGVPYSVKDLVPTAGVRTTMASAIYEDFVPAQDSVAVARSKAAGAILVGKTTTPEFGHKPAGFAPIFGQTLNPHNPAFTCGGSSSGAAVAVAAGMAPLAVGTDGGGSIRIPASCCGIVGLKPTRGVVPHLHSPDLFSTFSYTGPMARDAADTRLFFDVMAGPDRLDPFGQSAHTTGRVPPLSLSGLKVAWLPSAGNRVDPQVSAATTAAVRLLENMGAIVETVEIDFVALERHFLVIFQSSFAARVGDDLERYGNRLDATLVKTVLKGRQHSAIDMHNAGLARTQCFQALQKIFATFDVLVSPTLSAPPLPVDVDVSGIVEIAGEKAGTVRGAWYPYTFPINLSGHPALSMPCGRTTNNLPIGLQIVGRWFDDHYILGVASLLEQMLGETT